MKDAIKGLINSKKFWVFVITVVVIILNKTLDLGLTGEDLALVGGGGIATILGFGAADHGKEKAKIESANGPKPDWLKE